MKQKLKVLDSSFAHSILGYCSDFQTSDLFTWDRNYSYSDELCVITDGFLDHVDNFKNKKIAWLIEPKCISPNSYFYVGENFSKFDFILTHEKTLLDEIPNAVFIPFGGCWIPPEDQKIYQKTKNVSIIASNKNYSDGHQLRHEVISQFKNKIDVYGRGYNPVERKLESLHNYRFSVVIENCKRDYWFTEKLIDCFVTGTVPIYWGCPSIHDFFDVNGIIIINGIEDLIDILSACDESLYISKIDSIYRNFEIAKNYLLPDDKVYFFTKELQ